MLSTLFAAVAIIAALCATTLPGITDTGGSATARWSWPVRGTHQIMRPFLAPTTEFGAGHRGIDIAAIGAVLAPADGVIHFAGVVVDRPLLSLDHGGGILSSYEPVEPLAKRGDTVHRGDVIGQLLPGHCTESCLHFGVRVDGGYVSPLLFLGGLEHSVLLPTRPLGSGAGVRARVALPQPLDRDVSVQLGRTEARVTKHLLYRTQVGAAVEQVRCRGVPQGVGSGGAAAGQVGEQRGDELVDGSRADAPTARTEEDRRGGVGDEFVTMGLVVDDRATGGGTEWHDALLRSLADDPNGETTEVDVARVESHDLADAKSGGIEQFHDREVAVRDSVPRAGSRGQSVEYSVHLVAGEHPGQMVLRLRSTKSGGGILWRFAGTSEPYRHAPGRRGAPGEGGFREPRFRPVPQPVPQQFEIDTIRVENAVARSETCQVSQVRAVRPHGVRAETAFDRQVVGEPDHSDVELHSFIVTAAQARSP